MKYKSILALAVIILLSTVTCFSAGDTNVIDDYFGTVYEQQTQFTDIEKGTPTEEAVSYLAKFGIVNGFGDGTFCPEDNVTRAQFVKIIVCAFGLYDSEAECNFRDCDETQWFYPYVSSAVSAEMVKGIDMYSFAPNNNITREDMYLIAYRCAKFSGKNFENSTDELPFPDKEKISEYTKEAVTSLYYASAAETEGEESFRPREKATRAEASRLIFLLLKNT